MIDIQLFSTRKNHINNCMKKLLKGCRKPYYSLKASNITDNNFKRASFVLFRPFCTYAHVPIFLVIELLFAKLILNLSIFKFYHAMLKYFDFFVNKE